MHHVDPHNVSLDIATNTHELLMTGFVLQGHKSFFFFEQKILNNLYTAFFNNNSLKKH